MLEIGFANDPGQAVRRAELMPRLKTVEAQHALTGRGQVIRRSAAHGAETDHDHIVIFTLHVAIKRAGRPVLDCASPLALSIWALRGGRLNVRNPKRQRTGAVQSAQPVNAAAT